MFDKVKIGNLTVEGLSIPQHFYAWVEIFLDDEYKLSKYTETKFDYIVDIGANVGYFSLGAVFFGICSDNFILVEPHPLNLSWLKKNIKSLKNIKIVDKAISSSIKKIRLTFNYGGTSLFRSDNEKGWTVKTTTPKDIFQGINGRVLLKMDIEGSEWDVLPLLPFGSVGVFMLEFHLGLGDSWSVDELLDFIKKKGFEVVSFSYHEPSKAGQIIAEKKNN